MISLLPTYRRIGLFDSGVGGLSVLRRLAQTMPDSEFFYLGDTARLPYGNRSKGEVENFVAEIVSYLATFEIDAVVMACNTSAALALDVAQECAHKLGIEVFDLIGPTNASICRASYKTVGVLATQATVRSGAFSRGLKDSGFGGQVLEVGCPKLVPLIESGRLGEPALEAELSRVLGGYLQVLTGSEAIVLGCTHYAFVADRIRHLVEGDLRYLFPTGVSLIDPAVALSEHMRQSNFHFRTTSLDDFQTLKSIGLDTANFTIDFSTGAPDAVSGLFFATGTPEEFARSAGMCLDKDSDQKLIEALGAVRHIAVESLVRKTYADIGTGFPSPAPSPAATLI